MNDQKQKTASAVLGQALTEQWVRSEDTAVVFYDLDLIQNRVQEIQRSFPVGSLHAVAIKANPVVEVLRQTIISSGGGLEAATIGELRLAFAAGALPQRVVYDSPTKTEQELRYALEQGVYINIDNLQEMQRVAELASSYPEATIGVRINPQVGLGKIADTSVADKYSKFGIPLERRQEIIECFVRYPWLQGVHLHVGSQGCPLEMFVEGIVRIFKLTEEVAAVRPGQIKSFDIGGGLPVRYHSQDPEPSVSEYVAMLRQRIPELFDGRFRLITEFGRYVHANAGWTVSRVEYIKQDADLTTAMIHVGGELFIRKCLQPNYWHNDISVTDAAGNSKNGETARHNLAGPLCFAGDIIAKGVMLPQIEPGDHVIIHDTGAYTLALWSRYNSRQVPRVLGYRCLNDHWQFQVLKEREKLEDLVSFWSLA